MTIAEIQALAQLARLELSPDEMTRLTSELTSILAYADHIQKIPLEGVEPTAHPLDAVNVWRDDVPAVSLPVEDALESAPDAERNDDQGGFFLVPAVLE